jgi:coenzyme F420-0:L-glutamate ligase/coenzyme F420-1:gamma-L-glutamate ligase
VTGGLTLLAVEGVGPIGQGDDVAARLLAALATGGLMLCDGDVLCVVSKVISKAEGRFVDLSAVVPSERALALAEAVGKEPELVEVVLSDSAAVSRAAPGVLITRHRLGHVCANAGVDRSNARPAGAPADSGPWALLLPSDPDASARALRAALEAASGAQIGVVITDSLGRPFREGSVGHALGVAGLPALGDQRGDPDLDGRTLEHTVTALADQVAAAADLVAGQAAEGRAAVIVRGLSWAPDPAASSAALRRPADRDLYA